MNDWSEIEGEERGGTRRGLWMRAQWEMEKYLCVCVCECAKLVRNGSHTMKKKSSLDDKYGEKK